MISEQTNFLTQTFWLEVMKNFVRVAVYLQETQKEHTTLIFPKLASACCGLRSLAHLRSS